jgi:hypothetical protein
MFIKVDAHIDYGRWLLLRSVFAFGARAPSGTGPPHSRSHTTKRLLWTGDQLVAETSTLKYTQNSQLTNIHVPGGIRTHNLSRQAAAVLRLRPRGNWDRLCYVESTKSRD